MSYNNYFIDNFTCRKYLKNNSILIIILFFELTIRFFSLIALQIIYIAVIILMNNSLYNYLPVIRF